MSNSALRSPPGGVRKVSQRRRRHRLAPAADAFSVAGLIGSDVFTVSYLLIGRIEDFVVRWDEPHPPLVGVIVCRGSKHRLIESADFAALYRDCLVVREHPTPHFPHVSAPDVRLARDVLDRQILDADGADAVRVSDLALMRDAGAFRLAGVDVSARTLLRRAGPVSLRRRVAADRLYDWAGLGTVDGPGSDLRFIGRRSEAQRR
jgi:hypothetical protein